MSDIAPRITRFLGKMSEHHRYRSWEHCYRFFHARPRNELLKDSDLAALNLGFYLASWGMYRGSSFLLQHDYKVHKPIVTVVLSERLAPLWRRDIGGDLKDSELVPLLLEAVGSVKTAYQPFGEASDILVTKVLLGTLGCLPACDRYFTWGFQLSGRPYSYLNRPFIERVLSFSVDHVAELRDLQHAIYSKSSVHYPLMKLVDMFFWQGGYEADGGDASES